MANVNRLHAQYTFPACMYFPVCMYFALLLDTAKRSRCRLDTVNKQSQGASEQKMSTKRPLDTTTAVVETRRKTFSGEKHNYQTIPTITENEMLRSTCTNYSISNDTYLNGFRCNRCQLCFFTTLLSFVLCQLSGSRLPHELLLL